MLQQRDNRVINNGAALPQATRNYGGGMAIPIPGKNGGKQATNYHTSSSGFFSSSEEESLDGGSPHSGSPPFSENMPMLSSSYHAGAMSGNNIPLNIYGTSPRTSVMFNYYASPKGSYNRTHPRLIRTRSTDTPQANSHHNHSQPPQSRSENISFHDNNDNNIHPDAEKYRKPDSSKISGKLSHHLQQQLDLRPRAWSESDKNRSNSSLQNSRMSALRKLKMKIGGQKSSLKRQKSQDENDERNKSTASVQALEKVEEGRQLDCSTPRTRPRSQGFYQDTTGSLHQEHETRRKLERRVGVTRYTSPPPPALPLVNENPEDHLIYQRFLEEHTCYDLMPTSSKLVLFDTRLEVRKAFHALIENSLRCAPLWDSTLQDYVGLLTVSDFVSILLAYHKCPNKKLEDLENQKISCWRDVLNSRKTLVHCPPQASLLDALRRLTDENIRRLAIVHPDNGDVFHVINHRRILHFLHLFMNELPKPEYMVTPLGELGIGTSNKVATVQEEDPVIDALQLLDELKVSALPVVDHQGRVTDMFTKTDVLVLAGEQLFYDLSIKVKSVISLHSVAELDSTGPAVTRMMPGSPALPRRRMPSGQDHSHNNNSTPVKAHPFLRDFDNTPKQMPSPLVSSSISSKQHNHTDKKTKEKNHHHHNTTPPVIRTPGGKENLARGDPANNPQVLLHRRRHLSSNLSKSTSISSHLVTVTKADTLEFVVNAVVVADALQAVVVDDFDHVQGVVSIGDILRFMVYPTNQDGDILDESLAEKPPVGDKTSSSHRLSVPHQSSNRIRAASDDTDLTSSLDRKHSQNISDRSGPSAKQQPISSTPPGRNASARPLITSFNSNSTTEKASSKGKESLPKMPFGRRLKSGEKIDRL